MSLETPLVVVDQHAYATAFLHTENAAPGKVGIFLVGPVGTCENLECHAVADAFHEGVGGDYLEEISGITAQFTLGVAEDVHVEGWTFHYLGFPHGNNFVLGC